MLSIQIYSFATLAGDSLPALGDNNSRGPHKQRKRKTTGWAGCFHLLN